MAIVRILLGYLLAVTVATALGSAVHTQMIVAGLTEAGALIQPDVRLAMTFNDFVGLAPQFGVVVAIALAIGFLIAAGLKRILKPLAPVAFPLAGAAAIAVALTVMHIAFDGITPIAGARTPLGFALECLAGAAGGLVFSMAASMAAGRRRG
jgi:hypothetical protein